MSDSEAHDAKAYRPIGNPLPIGLLGLMVASSMYAVEQLGWIPQSALKSTAVVVLCAGVFPQLMSAVFGLLGRDPITASSMTFLAGAWVAISVSTVLAPHRTTAPALGVLLITLGVALLVPAVAGVGRVATAVVFVAASARLVVTGAYELLGGPGLMTASGALGLALGAVALYAASAFELESAHGRAVLPIGRRTPVRDQPPPGVRPRL